MRPSPVSKSSTARCPTTPSSAATRRARLLASPHELLAQLGGRGDDRVADPVDLDRLDDRVGDGLAVRRADDVRRQLPYEVDLLLGEDRDTGPERFGRVLLGADHPDTLAVVSAADRLQDDREAADLGRERRGVGRVRHDAVAGAGHTDRRELGAHHPLVLGVHQRVGTGTHGDAVRLQGPQVLGRDVLVIEGDHVTAAREGTQRVQVAIVADDDFAHHLGRRVLRGVAEELESDAEGDTRLVGHTGELTAADHADYRKRHSSRVSGLPGTTGRRPCGRSRDGSTSPGSASAHRHPTGVLVSMTGLTESTDGAERSP